MAILIPIFLVAFASILAVVGISTSYFKSKQTNQIRSMLRNAEASQLSNVQAQCCAKAKKTAVCLTF